MNRSRVTGDLASQGNIFVDIANDRVGIGSTIPTQKLDVVGTVKATAFSGDGSGLSGVTSVGGDTGADFNDSVKIRFGTGNDLELYHDGSHSYIHDGGTGNLKVRSNNFRVSNADESKMSATFQPAGAVELYHNHSKKLETTSGGVTVSDNLTLSGGNIYLADTYKLMVGTNDDLQLYHDGTNDRIDSSGTYLILEANNHIFRNPAGNEDYAKFLGNGAVELYHNGNQKFATTSSGVDVTGTVTADNQIVLNSGDSTPARIDLYCEVSNAHYTRLQAPAHSTYSGNVTVTIPNTSGNLAVLANAADNRIVTATGTHAMTGETNFTYDGTNVINTISGAGGYKITTTSDVAPQIRGNANRATQRATLLSVNGEWNGTHVTMIDHQAGPDTTNKDDGQLAFYTRTSGGSLTQRSLINSTGQTLIGITGNGTEAGSNTKLCVRGTGTPGSGPSTIQDNTVATFRMTGSTGHAASIAILAGNTGSSAVHFGDTDNDIIGRILYNHTSSNTSDYFEFFLQGSRRFRINGNGNLSIGNDSNFTAGAKVEIRDTIGGGGGTGLILNDIGSSGATEGLHIEWRSGSDKQADQCRIGQSSNATGSGSNFFIATNSADSGSSTTRLTVQSDGTIVTGNVSIPTSSDIGNIYIKNASAIGSQSHQINYVSNAYFNGAWKYINSSLGATMITVNQNGYTFNTAGSGTANNNITFSNKFNIASTGAIAFSGAYGSSGQVLTSQGSSSAPTWTTVGSGGINISTSGADLTMNSAGSIFTGNGGNATDPIVANVSDTNTGYFYPAADQLAFTTGGTERMRLTSGGTGSANVLIGGTNATTHSNVDQLIIGGTSGTNGITIKSGTTSFGCLYFHDEDTTNAPKGQIEYQHGTEQMSFYANQELMMRIDGDEDEGRLSFTPNVVFSGSRNSNIINETVMFATSQSDNQAYHDNHTITFGQTNGNWQDGTTGADSSWGMMWHYSPNASSTRALRAGIAYDHRGTEQLKIWSSYGAIVFKQDLANGSTKTAEECDTECARFDDNGHFVPGANNARDLGTSAKKWRNIHVMDMHFSNDGGDPNSVDGTTGDWTLQEGENGIYMINNKNGKKYEMMLKEVQ